MQIRDAKMADLPAIVEIYNASIPERLASADTEPVSCQSRRNWFNNHSPTSRPLWVTEKEDKIVAWLGFQSFYGRPAYSKTAELSIYVAPDYRRQGIGKQLLQHAIQQSPSLGINTLLGLIFAHNAPSLKLFTGFDFQSWGYLPGIAELDGSKKDLVIVGRRTDK